MTQEPNVQQAVPFLAVASMEASLRFYVDGLGFQIAKRWQPDGKVRWCWLELGNAALMLQEFDREGHDAWTPSGKSGDGITLYFICRDAIAIYKDAKSRGLVPAKPFVGNGMWVVALRDPDGYNIAFESVTDAREDSEYEEPE